ncbi:MAG: hypothetical protein WEF50_04625 [Myxococcota bacterium]
MTYIVVRRQWNDWRDARIPLSEFQGPHWDDESGGVHAVAPQYFIHGYVYCTSLGDQEFAHSCAHGRGPHRIKVCVVKKANDPKVFESLVAEAGPKPKRVK